MCQAFEGEQALVCMLEEGRRRRGYQAYQQGVPKEECPELTESDAYWWRLGWDIAASGRELW